MVIIESLSWRGSFAVAFVLLSIAACASAFGQPVSQNEAAEQIDEPKNETKEEVKKVARGIVFSDTNNNGKFDSLEPRISNVKVSNGVEIVQTQANGTYEIPVTDDSIVFVIKPRGWATPLDENKLPQFYYIHKPKGSPPTFKYKGVEPTGPLPDSIDFPLYPQQEPDQFRAILFGDPQPRNQKEVDFISHDIIEELIGTDASFGVTLGDIAFDNLDTFDSLNETIGLIGIPWYNVVGNHDINYDARTDKLSDETFERVYGPAYYSFDYGQVHFLVIDDIDWYVDENDRAKYRGGIGADQLKFIENDLAKIPAEQMVVLLMHVPIVGVHDRQDLYRLIEQRPCCISVSGHTHHHEHRFIGGEDGWKGPERHHHIINVTVSGSWWGGAKDERGIPHSIMADGAPNGYSIISFDGKRYKLDFKAAGRDAKYQMQIYASDEIPADETDKQPVVANIFNATEFAKVEMQIGDDSEWIEMKRKSMVDPNFAKIFNEEEKNTTKEWTKLPKPKPSTHVWIANLPSGLKQGIHLIRVRAIEPDQKLMKGAIFKGNRTVRITEE